MFRYPNYGFGYPAASDPYSYGYARQQPHSYRPVDPRLSRYQAQREAQQRAQRQRARAYIPDEYADSSDEDDPARFDYGLSHSPFPMGFGGRPSPKSARSTPSPPKPTHIPVRSQDEQAKQPPRHSKTESPPPPQPSVPLEVQEAAVIKIQQAYRLHHSIKTIKSIESKFEEAKKAFTFPQIIDFQDPADREKIISVSVSSASSIMPLPSDTTRPPKLAYNSHNAPLHAYIESLNRLLTSLDAVDSRGNNDVRQHRKQVVRRIEKELEDIEGVDPDPEEEPRDEQDMLKGWKGLWRRFIVEAQTNQYNMAVDEELDTRTAEEIPVDDRITNVHVPQYVMA